MDNTFEKTKAFCDSFLELSMPGFDLAVYHEGKCVLRYINGYSDLENKIEMSYIQFVDHYDGGSPLLYL